MTPNQPTISFAILTYNRSAMLGKLLASLHDVASDAVEVIVVDNHSDDDTPQVVASAPIPVTYLRTEQNIGVVARNLGLRHATSDIVVCLDDDLFGIEREELGIIRRAFAEDSQLAAINFKVMDPHTNQICNWVHHCEQERYADSTFETYEITEGAVAFRKSAVAAAGWYAESFFFSHEGPDLALRLINQGYRAVYRGDIVVQHWRDEGGRQPWMNHYYDTRNQYWLAARHFPLGHAVKYLFRGQVATCIYSLRDGHFAYWLKAVFDGVRGLSRIDRRIVSDHTMRVIREIDARRPSWLYMARKRLFHGMRL